MDEHAKGEGVKIQKVFQGTGKVDSQNVAGGLCSGCKCPDNPNCSWGKSASSQSVGTYVAQRDGH